MQHDLQCIVLVVISLSANFAFGQNEMVLDPANFLSISAEALDYEIAYLVTEGDTLMTWHKEGDQTIATYLNIKITKTVWADSVEVCGQEGFMLDDFEEYCERRDNKDEVISKTYKNVEEFRYYRKRKDSESFFVKSYSLGLLFKGQKGPDGELSVESFGPQKKEITNLDALFEFDQSKKSPSKTKREGLMVLRNKKKLKVISNRSEFNTFKLIEGLRKPELKGLKSHLYYAKNSEVVKQSLKNLVIRTTYDLDLD